MRHTAKEHTAVAASQTQASDCFVPIPETVLPGGLVVPAFQLGQYATGKNPAGRLAVTADAAPWVNINYHTAVQACEAAGYRLARESQRLAVAYHVAAQPENWTGGQVGKGKLYQGLRKWTAQSAQPASVEPTDPDERRWFAMPGGHRIYDIAGNVWQWTWDDIQGDAKGIIARAIDADSPSLVIPYPAEDKGQGYTPRAGADWSGYALFRGGSWRSDAFAGAFYLRSDWPSLAYGGVGFRCTK